MATDPFVTPRPRMPFDELCGPIAGRLKGRHLPARIPPLVVDAVSLTVAILAAGPFGRSGSIPIFVFAALVLILLRARGSYRFRLRSDFLEDVRSVATASALAAMAVLSLRLLAGGEPYGTDVVGLFAIATLTLPAGRLAFRSMPLGSANESARAGLPTLIVGAGRVGHRIATRLLRSPGLGLRPIGFLDDAPLERDGAHGLRVLGGSRDLDRIVYEHRVEHVIVAFSVMPYELLVALARRCEELGVKLSIVPRLFERTNARMHVEHVGGLPIIALEPTDPRAWQLRVKHAFDRVAAIVLVIATLPLLLGAAAAVWLSLGRPIVYRQLRVGRDGRPFDMLKLRTMRPAADGASSPVHLPPDTAPGGGEGEDRCTRVGAIVRRSSLDELPQLFNVLRGQMSLVGPRPEQSEYVALFESDVRGYRDRHRMRAGMTGWAQVNGLRGNTSLSERVEWDNHYIDNWSFWFDLKILFLTARALVRPNKT